MAAPAPARIGSYEITGELGRGGMGVVYDARDTKIGRAVALKTILWRDLGDDQEREFLRDRLFREARSAGSLNHPGVVTIYDAGEDSERAYIAMEKVEGPTLQGILASGRVSDRETLLSILEQTAEALDFAHEGGVVHRDVKPANIMLHRNSRVKIADFGIAKVLATTHRTKTGLVMGTPSYMSPEQMKAQPLDGRSDQFSLGVIAFEMLTGQKPFDADTLAALVHQIVYEEPRSLLEFNPKLGHDVDTVIRKTLSKNAASRYPTCAHFARALRSALPATMVEASVASKPEPRAKTKVWSWIAALVIIGSGCFGVGYVVGRGSAPSGVSQAKPSSPPVVSAPEPKQPEQPAPTKPQVDVAAHLKKAEQLQQQGLYNAAITEYDAVLNADPGNAKASSGRAKALKAKQTEENVLK